MSKIIIIGLDDLLTFSVTKLLNEESESSVIAITPSVDSEEYQCDKSYLIDIENNMELGSLMLQNKPDIIINTMVFSENVESLSSNRNSYINYLNSIISLSKKFNSKLIHFSNANVFSGIKGFYSEEDIPDAKDEYGTGLIEAEKLITENLSDYLIIRYSKIFGANENYEDIAVDFKANAEENKITEASNTIYNPIFINDLCSFLFFLIDKNKKGIYHAGSIDSITEFGLLSKVGKILELDLNTLELNENSNLNYSLNIYKAESEMIYKFSKVDNYVVSMKHFVNMSNKYYYN